MKELIKKLAKSRTIQGIAVAAIGIIINHVKELLPPEILQQYGPLFTTIIGSTEAGGLALAWYGRMKAAGPILPSPTSPTGGEATSFDGTSGELPK